MKSLPSIPLRHPQFLVITALFALAMLARAASLPPGLPAPPASGPALCVGAYLTPEQGQAVLDFTLRQVPTLQDWQARAAFTRGKILSAAGLVPLPRRTPLNPIIRDRRVHDGYSVENVALETVPGFFATGNLYRPLKVQAPFPVILCPHGHSRANQKPEVWDKHGRFHEEMQHRCAALARMGAVVLSIDMFGWGETQGQVDSKAHKTTLAQPMQIWDAMRAVDFLLSLEGADPKRVGVTGESGGGTQSFLLTALDSRVAVSVPVVMVSSYFFGGCNCESGRPIHRDAEHFTTNAEIAAMAAPRPMLVVSDGKDWTQHVPTQEFPFLRKIYALCGAEKNVENAHLPLEGHDYGPSKRAAMVRFMAARLGLNLAAIQDKDGKIDESFATIEPSQAMRVFTEEHPRPAGALKGQAAVQAALEALQK